MSDPGDPGTDEPSRYDLFVCGMSRGGTTWMAKCLNAHPDAVAWGESMYFGRLYVPPASGGLYDRSETRAICQRLSRDAFEIMRKEANNYRNIDPHRTADFIADVAEHTPDRVSPADLFLAISESIARREQKRHAIEKTPHHVNWIDRILDALPDARFVIMVRDAYGFALSYKHQGDRQEEDTRREFRALYHPLLVALVWRGYVRSALEAIQRWPDHTLMIDFEEAVRDPEASLEAAQRFFGLRPADLSNAVGRDNSSFPGGARPELENGDLFWIHWVARRELARMGTARRPFRLDGSVLRSFLALPRFAWAAARLLRDRVSGSGLGYLRRWLR